MPVVENVASHRQSGSPQPTPRTTEIIKEQPKRERRNSQAIPKAKGTHPMWKPGATNFGSALSPTVDGGGERRGNG